MGLLTFIFNKAPSITQGRHLEKCSVNISSQTLPFVSCKDSNSLDFFKTYIFEEQI